MKIFQTLFLLVLVGITIPQIKPMITEEVIDKALAEHVVFDIITTVADGLYKTKTQVENACLPIVCLASLNNEISSNYDLFLKETTRKEIRCFNNDLKELFDALTKNNFGFEIYKTLPKAFEKIKEHVLLISDLARAEPCLQKYCYKYNRELFNLAHVNNRVSRMASFLPNEILES